MRLYYPNSDVLTVEDDETTVIMYPSNGSICELDKVGRFIWNSLHTDAPKSIDQILVEICESFFDIPDNIKNDIEEYMEALEKNQIVFSEESDCAE